MIAIYARQSIYKADSISIETQIEDCKKELRLGERFNVYSDEGYSGKNTDRPQFQKLLEDIRKGEISKVICYKLDRVSRSVLDFSSLMEIFGQYKVDFVSRNEKFDTTTPMGRAMLHICIVFAQLERETIQQRVIDAYVDRSRKGFYMGGRVPFGFRKEDFVIGGKKTSHYVPIPEEIEILKLMYSLYAHPQVSVGDVVKRLVELGIKNPRDKKGCWDKTRVGDLMKNPIYVKADMDVYEFLKNQGAIIHNSPEDFIGVNGCYLYTEKSAKRKTISLEGHHIVLAPHEGVIDSHTWLKVRSKCLGNKQVAKPIKAKNTWLAGKIKCIKCGYALVVRKANTKIGKYFVCSHKVQTLDGCEGIGGLPADDIESIVFNCMVEKLKEFSLLSASGGIVENPKINELRVAIAKKQEEIDGWVLKIPDASPAVMAIINEKVEKLAEEKQCLQDELKDLTVLQNTSKCDIDSITDYMSKWDQLDNDDKIAVVGSLIKVIKAGENALEIEWKI
jgi:DNA invertase Pin-like site-specific DNA recombinase